MQTEWPNDLLARAVALGYDPRQGYQDALLLLWSLLVLQERELAHLRERVAKLEPPGQGKK